MQNTGKNTGKKIRSRILQNMDHEQDYSDAELKAAIEREVNRCSREEMLSLGERETLAKEIFHSFRKMDILQELLDDPDVTEILVNGENNIFYEREGQLYRWNRTFESEESLMNLIQAVAGRSNRSVNELEPIVDTRLPDGSRVNIVLGPVSLDGPCVSIRKFSAMPMTTQRLIGMGSISEEMVSMLRLCVISGYNIFVSGGTGSGKTTFLNALSQCIPSSERVITIEDSAELRLDGIPDLVRLETRESNVNGVEPITIRDLIRTALRMRPDRIIVGEVRGAEALDMLQAINTGHNGSMSTGHANSTADMLHRLETMVLMGMDLPVAAIRGQIAGGLDIMVHLARLRDHSRRCVEISEITGMEQGEVRLNRLYRFTERGEKDGHIIGEWEKCGTLSRREKLRAAGCEEAFEALTSGTGRAACSGRKDGETV